MVTMAPTAGAGARVVANATNTAKDTQAKSAETHTAARHKPLSATSHVRSEGRRHRRAASEPAQYQPRSAPPVTEQANHRSCSARRERHLDCRGPVVDHGTDHSDHDHRGEQHVLDDSQHAHRPVLGRGGSFVVGHPSQPRNGPAAHGLGGVILSDGSQPTPGTMSIYRDRRNDV